MKLKPRSTRLFAACSEMRALLLHAVRKKKMIFFCYFLLCRQPSLSVRLIKPLRRPAPKAPSPGNTANFEGRRKRILLLRRRSLCAIISITSLFCPQLVNLTECRSFRLSECLHSHSSFSPQGQIQMRPCFVKGEHNEALWRDGFQSDKPPGFQSSRVEGEKKYINK